MAKAAKYVYLFGNKRADGDGGMKPLLGGKGANLAEMSRIGLPVPPGFTITTEVCTHYYANKRSYPKDLDGQAKAGVAFIEKIIGTKFGRLVGENVRSCHLVDSPATVVRAVRVRARSGTSDQTAGCERLATE